MAMSRWKTSFHFVAPEELKMPDEQKLYLRNLGLDYHETTDLNEVINMADIVYMTRVQRERFSDPMEYEKVKNAYVLHDYMLSDTKPEMRILHPLPRVNEISTDVDGNTKAYYFEQALNGVYTRQAIICLLLGLK
jgi:aspartate carbamoyltransferase catalytic subunit